MNSKERKPYRKPEIEQVKLVPREAVLTVCKTASAGGGVNTSGNCTMADPQCIAVISGSPASGGVGHVSCSDWQENSGETGVSGLPSGVWCCCKHRQELGLLSRSPAGSDGSPLDL